MKKLAVFKQTVFITVEIEVPENATEEEMTDIAYDSFDGMSEYAGNGGMDKIVGVREENQRVELSDEIDFVNIEDLEDKR